MYLFIIHFIVKITYLIIYIFLLVSEFLLLLIIKENRQNMLWRDNVYG